MCGLSKWNRKKGLEGLLKIIIKKKTGICSNGFTLAG